MIDESYPKYLRDNIKSYDYLLYKEPTWYQKLWDKVSVWAVETRRKLISRKNK